jgi:glycosyltransferase involved in cell wall biosynthesis
MFVTVAICTWNRSSLLDQTLSRLSDVEIPSGVTWEVLVVNNNSTDDTDDVIRRHQDAGKLPIKGLFEPKQGVSHSRNRLLEAAGGDLILWVDDDVLVGRNWVAEYVRAAKKFPEAAYFGGPIRPWYEVTPPKWLGDQIQSVGWIWALLDHKAVEGPLRNGQPFYCANMAFRTEIERRYTFDTALGYVGATLGGGEEVAVLKAMQRDGHYGVWLPENSVEHFVPASRMTLKHIRNRAYQDGQFQFDRKACAAHRTFGGVPRWLLRKYVASIGKAWVGRLSGSKAWLLAFVDANWVRGAISACRIAKKAP